MFNMNWLNNFRKKPYKIICTLPDANSFCHQASLDAGQVSLDTGIHIGNGLITIILYKRKIISILEDGHYALGWVLPKETLINDGENLKLATFTRKTLRLRWGTPNPVACKIKDDELVQIRAHGTFAVQLRNPKTVWQHLPAEFENMTTGQFSDILRPIILSQFTNGLMNNNNYESKLNPEQLTEHIKDPIEKDLLESGVKLEQFLVQHISIAD